MNIGAAWLVAALATGPAFADPIAAIEGVYKQRHAIEAVSESRNLDVEDVVEVVRYDDAHVYLRARLWFHNGHVCGVSGIAAREGDAFVYREPAPGRGGTYQCTLTVRTVGDQLMLTDRVGDEATCSATHCGVNGNLRDYTIALSKRRPIRYMDRLKSSRQYLQAIHDLQESNLQRSDPGTTPEEAQRRHQE